MDLFSDEGLKKLDKEEDKITQFYKRNQRLEVVSSADPKTSFEQLLKIKFLFQKMLPKMPREYILRQVFDPKHCSLILKEGSGDTNFVGAVCYRPAFERELVEIVFFAIDSEHHINGYGTFLFNCLKEVCKLQYKIFQDKGSDYKKNDIIIDNLDIFEKEKMIFNGTDKQFLNLGNNIYGSDNDTNVLDKEILQAKRLKARSSKLYLLTYADNSAIGFFKKQGFTTNPVSSQWQHYIKDYDGGTLMECKLYFGINYLRKKQLIENVRNLIFEEMKKHNEFHIIREPNDREHLKPLYQKLMFDNKCQPITRESFLKEFIHFLICTLQSNPSAWPFLEPVNIKDVPDYAEVIKRPIDLSTIYKKYKNGDYTELTQFTDDFMLMVNNCYTYNSSETQYFKCGEIMQSSYEQLLLKYKDIIKMWGF